MSLQDELDPVLKERAATDSLTASRNASDLPWQYQDPGVPKNKMGIVLMPRLKILLVDDDADEIFMTRKVLESKDCEVVPAKSATEALKQIAAQRFDVLITDLHMPDPGDGFTLVTAMRHFQPEALTLVVSDYPDVQTAMTAILLQADEVLVKPFNVEQLALLIDKKKLTSKSLPRPVKENVASILDRDAAITIERWLSRVEQVGELTSHPLTAKERTEYLPEIIRNMTARLRAVRTIEAIELVSPAAEAHGQLRYRQGYTAPMMVQELRILQVCLFETIQRNLATVDFTSVLPDVMIIADEADSQLKQSIGSFLTMQKAFASAYSA
jgi:CheY-like chemotaxis protein